MSAFLNPPPLYVEIGPDRIKARRGELDVELPVERDADGRLTAATKERTIAELGSFLKAKSWQPRIRAWCAINSRGVSLRRLSLPAGGKDEFHQRLLLQIEAEFPLPPEELAWGWQPLGNPQRSNGAMTRQDLLVAAVKKEIVADYQEIFRACGTDPVFTLAAAARWNVPGKRVASCALLDVGARQAELTTFEDGVPGASRMIFWAGREASNPPGAALENLARSLKGSVGGATLFVSGNGLSSDFVERLARSIGDGCKCEWLQSPPTPGGSAALAGLEKFAAQGGPALQIRLDPSVSRATAGFAALDWKTWGARIGVLAAVMVLLPYAEALLLKPRLERKVAAFQNEAKRLTVIDRELDFLRNLKQSQPPYIEVLDVFSKAVPPGTHFDALSLNSHGQVSLRCVLRDGQQVASFRGKLIASGFFTNVVVEEQTPTPDQQRVNVRMSAQEMPAPQLQALSVRLAVEEARKSGAAAGPDSLPGAVPPGSNAPPVSRKEPK